MCVYIYYILVTVTSPSFLIPSCQPAPNPTSSAPTILSFCFVLVFPYQGVSCLGTGVALRIGARLTHSWF